ncbi:MAG TPA: four helix bundle protein [Thermodesulfobacteriota bacterium]|nr:four helix bundle protein [Thermodesulfobacteriota bacterium]
MYRFERLKAWQEGMNLVEEIYKLTTSFPKNESFVLVDQLRRAVSSVPLNIAEGSGCNTDKEFIQFLTIARRSLYEVVTAVKIAERLGYVNEEEVIQTITRCDKVGTLINGLVNSLRKSR